MKLCMQLFNARRGVVLFLLLFFFVVGMHSACKNDQSETGDMDLEQVDVSLDGVVNGIDTLTGLAYDESFEIVRANCITCHSAKLITQNRATREGWKGMLDWMRATQNLHDLGDNEEPILDYLAKHYAPENKGRRVNIEDVEWYVLESD